VSTEKLFIEPGIGESAEFLSEQLITYIGNKRALLFPIESAVQKVFNQLGRWNSNKQNLKAAGKKVWQSIGPA